MALEAGDDGLVFYRALAQHYQNALRPGGALVLEIGWQQREAVGALLASKRLGRHHLPEGFWRQRPLRNCPPSQNKCEKITNNYLVVIF